MGTPEYLSMMRLRKIWAEGSFSVLKREHCISRIRKRGILAATEECLLAAMALNLKRMVNAIFRYPQIYCSAGTTVGFSRIFAFANRSLIVHYLQTNSFCDIILPKVINWICFKFLLNLLIQLLKMIFGEGLLAKKEICSGKNVIRGRWISDEIV